MDAGGGFGFRGLTQTCYSYSSAGARCKAASYKSWYNQPQVTQEIFLPGYVGIHSNTLSQIVYPVFLLLVFLFTGRPANYIYITCNIYMHYIYIDNIHI